MEKKVSINQLILIFVLSLTLLPVQNIFGFEFPVLYLITVLWVYLLLFIFLGRIKITNVSKIIIMFFILIIIEILLSTIIGTIQNFNRFYFPNDIIHYFTRMLVFIFFYVTLYYKKIKPEFFIKAFLITLLIGMSIGVLQWIPWSGRELFLQLYPFRDGEFQLSMINRDLYSVRIHGWGQHATANGGVAMLAFTFGISIFIYFKKYKMLSTYLIILSLLNIVISQARAGMLAVVFSIFIFYIVHMYLTKKAIRSTIKYIIILLLISLSVWLMYIRENPFIEKIIYRWETLFETSGGARVDQIKYALSLIDGPLEFFFGISKAVQSRSLSTYYIEIEPINIFVLNGLIGFILQYGLLLFLLIYFLKNMRRFNGNKLITTLIVSSFVMLLSYQIFSIAYYFFREIRIGLIPWILIGATVGIIEYNKKRSYE